MPESAVPLLPPLAPLATSGRLAAVHGRAQRYRFSPWLDPIQVKPGDQVEPGSVLGQNRERRATRTLQVEYDSGRTLATIIRREGDAVKRGEVVAYYSYLFGLGYKEWVSPVDGTVRRIHLHAGAVEIEEKAPEERAEYFGLVAETWPGWGVALEVTGHFVPGAVGRGPVAGGKLLAVGQLPAGRPRPEWDGAVIALPGTVDAAQLERAYRGGARAVVAAGIAYGDLVAFSRETAGITIEEYHARYADGARRGGQPSERVQMSVLALVGAGIYELDHELWTKLVSLSGHWATISPSREVGGRATIPELFVADVD